MSLLSTLLFSGYRSKILGLLLLHPENRYHVREIARLTGTVAGSVHRELSKLAKAEILVKEVSGNQVYYSANRNCIIYEELVQYVTQNFRLSRSGSKCIITLRK
jgi:DNA-binding transcriptional ArsR family regulator